MKDLNLKLAILEALDSAGTNGMTTPTLRNQVQLTTAPTPLGTEITHATSKLEAEGFVVGVRDELDSSVTLWTITARGVAQLRARGR
ncbi:MAG TPA: hypothetical protein VM680_18550 [Verrucomicrobiae bacterium]|nr:hypothetical protein [Verrucomicrobiae bacterium]